MTNHTIRDGMIHNAVETRRADDTKILQKVNAAHREAFTQRLPGQLEHCMRLVAERLQACLTKPDGIDLSKPLTWPAEPDDIFALCKALESLDAVRLNWPINGER